MHAAQLDSLRLAWKWRRTRARVGEPGDIRYVEVRDAIVRVKVAGRGPRVLVMTPDPPNVIEHYDALYRTLADDVRLICYELPGFGHSIPRRGYGFSFAENARVLIDVLERVAGVPAILALSCAAGLAAIVVARERPELVSHVIAVQTPSLAEELRWAERIDRKRLVRTPIVGQLALALRSRAIAKAWYRAALGDRDDVPAYTDVALRALAAGGAFCLASGLQALARVDAATLGAVTQPSLAIWGTRDRTHAHTDRRSTLAYVPGARVVELAGAGHFPELEAPLQFRDALRTLLASRS